MTGPALPATLLAQVPGLWEATWSRLPGLSGGAWCATPVTGAALVVREAGPLEVGATESASALELAPPVRGAAEGWLVTELVPAQHVGVLELSRPTVLDEVALLLRRWHGTSCRAPDRPLHVARAEYRERASAVAPELAALLEPFAMDADRREDELVQRPAGAVTAHLDVAANLLRTPTGLRLIDFEYVARADPNRELGQLVWEGELGPLSAERLTAAYWRMAGDEDGSRHLAAVAAWTYVTGVTWSLWGVADPAMGLWARRSVERLRSHWTLNQVVDDTP